MSTGRSAGRKLHHVHHTLGNVDRLIAHALQIRIDFSDGQDETQVDRHGLLHRKQVERSLVDFALGGVNHALAFKYHLASGKIALDVCLAGAIHRLLRESAHAEQPLPQIVEPLLKTRAHFFKPLLT